MVVVPVTVATTPKKIVQAGSAVMVVVLALLGCGNRIEVVGRMLMLALDSTDVTG